MTKALQEVIEEIRQLPDDEQDTIAQQLIRLMSLASFEQD
jgi:hypothetical protein